MNGNGKKIEKVAIITGCASGIGLATAKLFVQNGYNVFGVDVTDLDVNEIGQGFSHLRTDLTTEGACERAVEICLKKYDRIDVLANVAGIMDSFASADAVTDGEWNKVMSINTHVPVQLMRAVIPTMKEQKKGAIVNVTSKSSTSGAAAGIAYTASKHALLGASKNVAWRFRNDGIRCNCVAPAGVNTNMFRSFKQAGTPMDLEAFNSYKPIYDAYTPDAANSAPNVLASDVADAILFLASDEARMVTGTELNVDNAWSTI